ncbi:MAG: hypothetical protein H6Q90_2027 [Deltaproteobacteria bacterium]|nr:hypothetical protein [Deltaproteobacteria bacterium]
MKPTAEELRELGENSTNVANAWAGADNYLSRGLKAWTLQTIGRDRQIAVRAAVAACDLVVVQYNRDDEGLPARTYVDDMFAAVKRWLSAPTKDHAEAVRSSLDVTRSAHAWQRERDVMSFWILEAVDHASLAVWSGERASYIVPMDYATCAARSVACVLHAMKDGGVDEVAAIDVIVAAVRGVVG